MEEVNLRLTLVGLGLEAVAIGLLQSSDLPGWVPWLVVGIGLAVIAYGVSPFSVTGVRRLALYLPVSPKKTTTREQHITLAARLRWSDSVGKPLVNALDGRLRHAATAHHVKFDRGWTPDEEDAPGDPKTFIAVIVAELGTSGRPIRLQIGEDIWRTGEIPMGG